MAIAAHLPDLNIIDQLTDQEVKFYALIGGVVSLAAAIELSIFSIYGQALSQDSETAGLDLFKTKRLSSRRDEAIKAMTRKVIGTALESEWATLADRLKQATRGEGLRNLIAHNVVTRLETTGAFGDAPFGAPAIGGGNQEDFFVFQDHQRIIAGVQKHGQADYYNLRDFASELISLLRDIDRFLHDPAMTDIK